MPLLNYTTSVSALKTAGEIQAKLVKAGATHVAMSFDGKGEPTGLTFGIVTPIGPRSFALPVVADRVFKVITRWDSGVPNRYQTREQATRVGWRILKDWVEAQLAIVETEMVELEQVMLPYMRGDDGRTLYDLFCERQLALPGGS